MNKTKLYNLKRFYSPHGFDSSTVNMSDSCSITCLHHLVDWLLPAGTGSWPFRSPSFGPDETMEHVRT